MKAKIESASRYHDRPGMNTSRKCQRRTKAQIDREIKCKTVQAIRDGCEVGLEMRRFRGKKGRGIVAVRPFKKGEFVVEYAGDLIDTAEAERRMRTRTGSSTFMYYFRHNDKRYCVDATRETGALGRLINHGNKEEINLITKKIVVDGVPKLGFFAKDEIAPGHELLYDYGDRRKEVLQRDAWLRP